MPGIFRRKSVPAADPPARAAPAMVHVEGGEPFDLASHMRTTPEGFPMLDWRAVWDWTQSLDDQDGKARAWRNCADAWLLHLRDALGKGYRLEVGDDAVVLSSLETRQVRATQEFMTRTLSRVAHVLKGIADPMEANRVLVVFDDEDTYYRYAAQFDSEPGEYAFSSGMHIGHGFSHFIVTKADLGTLEPVVAHELTHASVRHLPLPLWLNEGLAVNTERQLCGAGRPRHTPIEMHAMHVKFWDRGTIQEFWSGSSFRRPDDGNMLSYDLARVLVEQLSADWARFAAFVNAAHFDDAGAQAASRELGIDLGAALAAMLEKERTADWAPDPQRWKQPETRTE